MTDLNPGKTPDNFTYLNPADFAKLFAPDLPLEQAQIQSRNGDQGREPLGVRVSPGRGRGGNR